MRQPHRRDREDIEINRWRAGEVDGFRGGECSWRRWMSGGESKRKMSGRGDGGGLGFSRLKLTELE